ncbi:hypothetical protein BKA80DRAFT_269154 [Phyllosticta citrichinensis]
MTLRRLSVLPLPPVACITFVTLENSSCLETYCCSCCAPRCWFPASGSGSGHVFQLHVSCSGSAAFPLRSKSMLLTLPLSSTSHLQPAPDSVSSPYLMVPAFKTSRSLLISTKRRSPHVFPPIPCCRLSWC